MSILGRDEIAALIAEVQEKKAPTDINGAVPDERTIRPLTLGATDERIIRGRLPALEFLAERLARSLRQSLSRALGRGCFVHPGRVSQEKFGAWVKRLPMPAHLHLFRMPPLSGQGVGMISSPLALSFVDVMMGGSGRGSGKAEGRECTLIESRLLAKVFGVILEDFQAAWEHVMPLHCVYVRAESNPLAVSVVPPTDGVVLLALDVEVEQTTAELVFCLPWQMLQPLREKLSSAYHSSAELPDRASRAALHDHLRAVPVELRVLLGTGVLKVSDLLNLKQGDVIPLLTAGDAPASVQVGGKEKFRGFVGTSRGRRCVKIIANDRSD
jgi:flagellar motor switch protein FliM